MSIAKISNCLLNLPLRPCWVPGHCSCSVTCKIKYVEWCVKWDPLQWMLIYLVEWMSASLLFSLIREKYSPSTAINSDINYVHNWFWVEVFDPWAINSSLPSLEHMKMLPYYLILQASLTLISYVGKRVPCEWCPSVSFPWYSFWGNQRQRTICLL